MASKKGCGPHTSVQYGFSDMMQTSRFAWLLSLAVWLSLFQYGMSTARLGESESSYGILDDSVRPFLVARYRYVLNLKAKLGYSI